MAQTNQYDDLRGGAAIGADDPADLSVFQQIAADLGLSTIELMTWAHTHPQEFAHTAASLGYSPPDVPSANVGKAVVSTGDSPTPSVQVHGSGLKGRPPETEWSSTRPPIAPESTDTTGAPHDVSGGAAAAGQEQVGAAPTGDVSGEGGGADMSSTDQPDPNKSSANALLAALSGIKAPPSPGYLQPLGPPHPNPVAAPDRIGEILMGLQQRPQVGSLKSALGS
jgi:hypothetical protein